MLPLTLLLLTAAPADTGIPLRAAVRERSARDSGAAVAVVLRDPVSGPARINRTIRTLGADSMVVLRGVEDGKAYQKGLDNTTTARDLATLLLAIVQGGAVAGAGVALQAGRA